MEPRTAVEPRTAGHCSGRWSRLALAAGAVAALLPVAAGAAAPEAAAAPVPGRTAVAAAAVTRYGGDVSWPQCPRALGGYDLPMPAATAQFAVVGLTKGLPFTVNPCLASQAAWVAARGVPAQAYTIPAYPTAAQSSTYSTRGPWSAATRWGRLANVGYAEAGDALARLASAGLRASMIWIDVEPRAAQPWPTGTRAAEAGNRALLTGLARRLDEAGHPYGFYSNTSGWQTITGTWWVPGVPAWVTVGKRTGADAAAACTRPAFSGAVPHLAQWWDDVRDLDLTCAAWTAAPGRPWPPSGTHDLDGTWAAQPVGRDAATGALVRPGTGGSRRTLGVGWQGMDAVLLPGDLTGDGVPDLVARSRDSGTVWLYPRTAAGGWQARRQLAAGWSGYDLVVAAGDLTGDHVPDLLCREAATGALWLAAGTGAGALRAPVRVGSGWQVFDAVLGAGDVDGDGAADVLARRSADGTLWLYPGNGRGRWLPARRVGHGWGVFDLLAAPGDLTGDGVVDVVARDRAGRSWAYPADGSGGWRSRIDRGTDWSGLDLIS